MARRARRRKRSWADPQNPILWIGALSQKLQPHVKRRLILTLSFLGPAAEKPGPFQPVGQPAAPVAAANLLARSAVPAAPLIPEPKQVKSLPGAFSILAATPIIVGQKADALDRRAAEVLRRELEEGYGIKASIKTSAEVARPDGAIVLGEPHLNPLSAAVCRAAGVALSPKDPGPEGYVLTVSPSGVVVAGCDRAGRIGACKRSSNSSAPAATAGATVACTNIRDWPDFPMRAAHWSIRGKETGFQRRMIQRLLARHKVNTLFLECESIGWASHPELNPKGITPAEVADLVRYANEHFIEVIPQIQSLGHCEYWLLHKHPELAENPEAPYNYCPSNPDTYKLLFDLYREAEAIFHPRYFHIGHDELNDGFGICPRCKGHSPARLFADEVRKLRDYWAERKVPIMMWSDMLLAAKAIPGKLDACNGGPPLNIAEAHPPPSQGRDHLRLALRRPLRGVPEPGALPQQRAAHRGHALVSSGQHLDFLPGGQDRGSHGRDRQHLVRRRRPGARAGLPGPLAEVSLLVGLHGRLHVERRPSPPRRDPV